MVVWKQFTKISLDLPTELLALVDDAANGHYMSRSEYVRQVLRMAVTQHHEREVERLKSGTAHNTPAGLENDPRIWDLIE